MSYSTGTADSRENLLDLFRAFAISSGWTLDRYAVSGTGYVLNLHKTGMYGNALYANLRSINNEQITPPMPSKVGILLSMSDTYDASKDCLDQPGAPANTAAANQYYATSINSFTSVAKYWFFSSSNPEFLAMVILLPNNEFRHLVFGEILKTDTTVGKGAFMFGTNGMGNLPGRVLPFETNTTAFTLIGWHGTSWLRLTADERDGWFTAGVKIGVGLGVDLNTTGKVVAAQFRDSLLLNNSLNNFSNSAALLPVNIYAQNQVGKYFMVGHIPQWRIARRSAFIVDQVYTLGADEWMAFPTANLTDTFSLVYRKVI